MLRVARRFIALLAISTGACCGYSVLSHEAIVDSLWDNPIQQMLLVRFPGAAPADLAEAHAYAYGGCIIQDMGYYPFSSKLFSDLTHYVRSGDFVTALISESRDINEYAFALGALAHYAADISGHGEAVNPAVPILYPELRARFGAIVTYWDSPLSHIRTEFGFDVLQVARGRYASDGYRAFIGFKVSKDVLARAVMDTYGLQMSDLFGNHLDLALETFRYTTSSVIPQMTRLAWQLRRETILKESPGITKRKFLFNLSRSSYEKDWGGTYQRPGIRSRLLAILLRMMPKSGPLKGLAFRAPNPQVEALFMKSFNTTIDQYRALLTNEGADRLNLRDMNFDTGAETVAGQYRGADLAYDELLDKLAGARFSSVTAELRDNILKYYSVRKPLADAKPVPGLSLAKLIRRNAKTRDDWQKTVKELEELRQFQIGLNAGK